jgi:hypothetical protein
MNQCSAIRPIDLSICRNEAAEIREECDGDDSLQITNVEPQVSNLDQAKRFVGLND